MNDIWMDKGSLIFLKTHYTAKNSSNKVSMTTRDVFLHYTFFPVWRHHITWAYFITILTAGNSHASSSYKRNLLHAICEQCSSRSTCISVQSDLRATLFTDKPNISNYTNKQTGKLSYQTVQMRG